MKKIVIFFGSVLLLTYSYSYKQTGQYQIAGSENSMTPLLISLNEAREMYRSTEIIYRDIVKSKIAQLNRLSSSDSEKYGNLKMKSDSIANALSDLNGIIESLKDEAKVNHFDNFNYAIMSDDQFYHNILFDDDTDLLERGIKLKEKIEFFYESNSTILRSFQNDLKQYNDSKFKTDNIFEDYEGNKIDYINYKLLDKTVIGTLSY